MVLNITSISNSGLPPVESHSLKPSPSYPPNVQGKPDLIDSWKFSASAATNPGSENVFPQQLDANASLLLSTPTSISPKRLSGGQDSPQFATKACLKQFAADPPAVGRVGMGQLLSVWQQELVVPQERLWDAPDLLNALASRPQTPSKNRQPHEAPLPLTPYPQLLGSTDLTNLNLNYVASPSNDLDVHNAALLPSLQTPRPSPSLAATGDRMSPEMWITRASPLSPAVPKERSTYTAKGTRVYMACERCRTSKLKCDGRQPICTRCSLTKSSCLWKPKGKPGPKPKPRRRNCHDSTSVEHSPVRIASTMTDSRLETLSSTAASRSALDMATTMKLDWNSTPTVVIPASWFPSPAPTPTPSSILVGNTYPSQPLQSLAQPVPSAPLPSLPVLGDYNTWAIDPRLLDLSRSNPDIAHFDNLHPSVPVSKPHLISSSTLSSLTLLSPLKSRTTVSSRPKIASHTDVCRFFEA